MEQKNFGFIPPVITSNNFVLGALTRIAGKEINPSGDWRPYVPTGESQVGRFLETYNCTSYGSLNAIETLEQFLYGTKPNYSDRASGINAGTRPPGNDPHKVCEAIRKNGLVKDTSLPFDPNIMTIEQYYSPDPLTKELIDEESEWLKEYSFGHEWVFTSGTNQEKQQKLLEALKRSPVAISVSAWYQRENGMYYSPEGIQNNHWVTLLYGEPGVKWVIYDSYDNYFKELEWDYSFYYAKCFYLSNTEEVVKQISLYRKIIELLKKVIFLKNLLT